MKNIVIFGAPGAGKGTQSDKMIEKYGLGHISTGDVLRNEIKNGTELGKTAKGYIDNGQLIPDELMIDILASVYDSFGKDHAGVIFDGFPRKKRPLIFISRLFLYKNIALPDRKALFLFVQRKLLCIHPLDGNELVMV